MWLSGSPGRGKSQVQNPGEQCVWLVGLPSNSMWTSVSRAEWTRGKAGRWWLRELILDWIIYGFVDNGKNVRFLEKLEHSEEGCDMIRFALLKCHFGLLLEVLPKGDKSGSRKPVKAWLCSPGEKWWWLIPGWYHRLCDKHLCFRYVLKSLLA